MAGLDLTEEGRAAEVRALVRELQGYETRVNAGDDTEDWEARCKGVRDQLALRGERGAAPRKRAETREGRTGVTRGSK